MAFNFWLHEIRDFLRLYNSIRLMLRGELQLDRNCEEKSFVSNKLYHFLNLWERPIFQAGILVLQVQGYF